MLARRALTTLALSLFAFTGCVAEQADGEAPADDYELSGEALTGAVPVGSKLVTTVNLNLRGGASTKASVLAVVKKGETVTVEASEPESGFYRVSYQGQSGYCYGAYLELSEEPPAPPADEPTAPEGAPTAEQLLAALGSCNQISSGKYAKDADGSATVPVCGAAGAVWFVADLDVDCDGKKSAVCNKSVDAAYQSETAATDSKGQALNAATLPFVVVPLVSSRFDYKKAGLALGSVVAVIYKGRVEYGIIGDLGPSSIIGEASYAMAQRLGINPHPSKGGVDSGVTYVAFTGASARVSKKEDHDQAVSIGVAAAKKLVSGQ